MKRFVLLLILPLIALSSWASVEIDGICYDLNSSSMTATVVSSSSGNYNGNIRIPLSVTYGSKTYSVTIIGDNAFKDCSGLTQISIPKSVTSIGASAFYGCTGLTSVTIPNSVTSIGYYAFKDCSGLTSVTIGSSVTSIGNYAFWDCTGLTSITIPNSVTSIGYYAFKDCSGLTSITIPNSVTSIGDYAFDDCKRLTKVTLNSNAVASKKYTTSSKISSIFGSQVKEYIIGESVTSIGDYAFYNCTGLTSITIPNSVTSIGDYAFYCCYSLKSITIPNSVTSIGDYAFRGCTGLTSVTIGSSVTSIGENAFRECKGLTNITIPNSVTSIGSYAFCNCTGLTSVTIPNSVTSIGNYAFCNCPGLTNITIPNSVTSIGNYAFSDCKRLTSITIPNSVTSIGDYAFDGCTGLTKVTLNSNAIASKTYTSSSTISSIFGSQVKEYIIGESVTSIGNNAFYGCTGLTSITIPNSVTSIGYYVFKDCSGLTSVHISDIAAWCKISFEFDTSNPLIYAHHLYLNGKEITDLVIPNSVTSIGKSAFSSCTGLTSVTIGSSVTSIGNSAFSGCSGLTSITIPNSVTSIGNNAFYGCTGLTSITIPNSVTSIGDYAFKDCSGLTSVHISDIAAWCKISFEFGTSNPLIYAHHLYLNGKEITDLVIPNSVTSIGKSAFSSCTGLTSVTIPNSVTSIGENAFSGCTGLTSVTIPNSVTSIGENAFSCCYSLTSITIPNSVTSIGNNAFGFCKGLTSITIPNSVTSIGVSAFYGCTGLTSVTIPNSVTSIGISAFNGCSGLTKVTLNSNAVASKTYTTSSNISGIFGSQVKEYIIGESVTSIGDYAFYGCSGLTSVTIPNSVTSIGNSAFSSCSGLTSVTIPNSVTSIGNSAFSSCTGLTSIIIPNSLTNIGTGAFNDCSNLTKVILNSNSIVSKQYSISSNIVNCFGTQVKEYVLGNSITHIGEAAFAGSLDLMNINIPQTVTCISPDAFYYCPNLKQVVVERNDPEAYQCSEMAFCDNSELSNLNTIKLIVPQGSASAYQNLSPWSYFLIEEGTTTSTTIPAISISLNQTEATLTAAGATVQLTATVLPENASVKSVTWSSSDESVATVSATGLVTAVANGTATITATTADGSNLSATCDVVVSSFVPVTEVKGYFRSASGDGYLSYVSQDANLQCGTAKTEATIKASASYANRYTICLNSNYIHLGSTAHFTGNEAISAYSSPYIYKVEDPAAQTIRAHRVNSLSDIYDGGYYVIMGYAKKDSQWYMMSSENIVNKYPGLAGLLYSATDPGESIEFAAYADHGPIWKFVTNPSDEEVLATGVTLNKSTATLTSAGATVQLTATVTPSNASNKNVTWRSSNTSVATVSSIGLVTAVANGIATITATTADGSNINATCIVTVVIPTSQDQPDVEGKTFQLNCARGYVGYNGSELYGTTQENASEFAIVSYEGKNYMYDATNSAFVIHTTAARAGTIGNHSLESNNDFSKAVTGFVWGQTGIDTYPWYLEDDFGNWLQIGGGQEVCFNTWQDFESGNGGNTYYITIVNTDFDATAAIQMLDKYFKILATSVTLNQTEATLTAAGATVQLTATVLPENASNKNVAWSSSDESVATVSSSGLVTAVANGTATIAATANDGSGKSATCEVTVDTPILLTGISLSSSSSDEISQAINLKEKNFGFKVGSAGLTGFGSFSVAFWLKINKIEGSTQFYAIADKAGSWPLTDWGWNWSTIDKAGALTFTYRDAWAAVNPKTVQYQYPSGTMPINTWTHVTIVLDQQSSGNARHKLYINGKFQEPTVNVVQSTGSTAVTNQEDTYYHLISRTEDLYVSVGGPASGRAGINGVIDNMQLWKKAMTEEDVAKSMETLNPSNLPAGLSCYWGFEEKASAGKGFIAVGETPGLECGTYQLMAAEGEGRAIPTYIDQTYAAILTTLTSVGQTATLIAMVTPDDATDKSVTWSSSDEGVTTVSSDGVVTAVANGTAIITATANDGSGKSATCEVTVNAPVVHTTGVTLSKTMVTLTSAGETVQLTATVLPENASDNSVTWSSSDESVATVSSEGVVTAVANGTATITATTSDGTNLSASCEVTVEIEHTQGIPGDVNGDTKVNGADIVAVINYVLAASTVSVADVNGDTKVNGADIVAVINYVLSFDGARSYYGANVSNIGETGTTNVGTLTATGYKDVIEVALQNDERYTAFQFVLTLPNGGVLTDIIPNEARIGRHQLLFSEVGDGRYLVLGFENTNSTIAGNEGTLLWLDVNQAEPGIATITDILFFTQDAVTRELKNIEVDLSTGVSGIRSAEDVGDIYDMNGRIVMRSGEYESHAGRLPSGVYIRNGRKFIVKQ